MQYGQQQLKLRNFSRPILIPTSLPVRAQSTTTNGVSGTRINVIHRIVTGAGISTCCPSSTPSGLDLGPPYLRLTNIAGETLGFWCTGFSPVFSLLIPAFSLLYAPPVLTLKLHRIHNAPLPITLLERIPKLRIMTLASLHFPRKITFGQ